MGGSVVLRSGRLQVDGSWMFADNLGHVDGTGLGLDIGVRADASFRMVPCSQQIVWGPAGRGIYG